MSTKTTKTTAADTAETKAGATVGVTATKATEAVTGLFTAYFTAARKTVEGVIEVDKALIGYAREAAESYVALGKDTVNAKCLNDVIELQAAHAHARIGANAANAREVVEMTKDRAKEAYAPLKEVIDTYRPAKAA